MGRRLLILLLSFIFVPYGYACDPLGKVNSEEAVLEKEKQEYDEREQEGRKQMDQLESIQDQVDQLKLRNNLIK